MAGYVGRGMLAAAVCGEVFASPSEDAVLAAIRAVTGPAGGPIGRAGTPCFLILLPIQSVAKGCASAFTVSLLAVHEGQSTPPEQGRMPVRPELGGGRARRIPRKKAG